MKKAYYLLPVAAVALIMTACSSDDTVEDIKTKNTIAFNVTQDNSIYSRAAKPVTSSNLNDGDTDFEVWAFQGDSYYMGEAGDGVWIKHGTGSSQNYSADDNTNSGYWYYATAEKVAYWPGGTLEFYAISPAHDNYNTTNPNFIKPNVNATSRSFTYYADSTNNTNQKDVMYAHAEASSGVVTLPFKHALAQIVFMGKTTQANLTATVEHIVLHNITNGGRCTFTDAGVTWTAVTDSTKAVKYTATPSGGSGTINSTTATAITGGAGSTTAIDPLLLMPQTFNGDGNATTTKPSGTTPYVEVDYKLQNHEGTYIKGAASGDDEWAKIYIPLQSNWVAGNKYIYTLAFDANVITFTCTVDKWTDTPVDETSVNDGQTDSSTGSNAAK